jgi:hypothetical protein
MVQFVPPWRQRDDPLMVVLVGRRAKEVTERWVLVVFVPLPSRYERVLVTFRVLVER